jgi:hypothetical protein
MKYQVVLQHSEEDGGAACLATVAKHYGRTFAVSRVREVVGTGSRGTSLLGLRRGAEVLGFNARQVKATSQLLDQLHKISLPVIIHSKGYHWVVLYGQKGKKYIVADPGIGIRYLTRSELMAGWGNGVMLLLEPDDSRFYQQSSDKVGGFGRYLARVWPYHFILAQAIDINIAICFLSLASPLMMQLLTDDVLVRGDTQLLTTVAIGVIAMNLFRSAIGLVQSHLIGHFGQRLQLGLILEYGRKLLHLPLSYFEGRRSGEVVSRIADVHAINALVSQIVLGLPSQFFIAVVSLGLMLFYSWELTLASLAAFVIVTVANLRGQLEAQKRQAEGLRADLKEIVSMLALRPINVPVNVPEVKAITERQSLASKLVILTLGKGDFEGGFPSVTAQIWTEDNRLPTQCLGQLPAVPEILELYDRWQSIDKGFKLLSRLKPQVNQVRNFSKEDIYALAEELEEQLNKWLNSESFRPIDKSLREKFMRSDEVSFIIQSENIDVRRLPWHLWDFFKSYRKAEVALSALFYDRVEKTAPLRTKKRLLAILGNSAGINIEEDRQVLENLNNAETVFLVQPTRNELDKHLWDKQGWDILCFSGHSSSKWDGENGWIYINQTDKLTIDQLENALRTAIEQGLQLAIFNSCDGLGLARQLASLHIPQIIVMREPVPDRVAQEFLKNFLTALASGKSFHMAVRQSREMLQGLENEFPCATWLPVICINPAEVPMAWG